LNADAIDLREPNEDNLYYNDGSLSPILIPYDDAGYLLALAVTDEKLQ